MSGSLKVAIVIGTFIILAIITFFIIIQKTIDKNMFDPNGLTDLPDYSKVTLYYNSEYGYTIAMSDHTIVHNKTIIFCNGRFGNIKDKEGIIRVFRDCMNVNYITCDYPGFGVGYRKITPTIENSFNTVKEMYYKATELWPNAELIIWGHSLGSYFALRLAKMLESKNIFNHRIILLSPFSTVLSIKINNSIMEELLSQFINRCNNVDLIKNIKAPKIILHSKDDTLISSRCAQELIAATNNASLIQIGGDHDAPTINKHSAKMILSFMDLPIENIDVLINKFNTVGSFFNFNNIT